MQIERVLIADDHELILTSISKILIEKFLIKHENLGMFTTPEQALESVKKVDYDLYILDLEYRKISGFDLIKEIRKINKEAKIIVCTMHQEIWNINRLLDMKVNGVILKTSANIYLEQAIDSVSKGETFLCPNFKEIKEKSQAYRKKKEITPLTERELEILHYIADGYKSREIGQQLGISENAVENHRKSLFLKLDVNNVVQLVRKAIFYRIIEL